jgi:hypothetical protein
MGRRRPFTTRGAQKQSERERSLGLDADDEAARWLQEHGPPPVPTVPKTTRKSKALHRWRQQRARE